MVQSNLHVAGAWSSAEAQPHTGTPDIGISFIMCADAAHANIWMDRRAFTCSQHPHGCPWQGHEFTAYAPLEFGLQMPAQSGAVDKI